MRLLKRVTDTSTGLFSSEVAHGLAPGLSKALKKDALGRTKINTVLRLWLREQLSTTSASNRALRKENARTACRAPANKSFVNVGKTCRNFQTLNALDEKNGSTYLCLLLILFLFKDALEAFLKLVILCCIFLLYFMDKHVSQPGIF